MTYLSKIYLISIVGFVIFLLIGIVGLAVNVHFFLISERTVGVVVDIAQYHTSNFTPKYQYTVNGKKYLKHDNWYSKSGTDYEVNQEIEVLYNKRNPLDAKINDHYILYWLYIIALGQGVGCLILFLLLRPRVKS